MRRWWLVAVSAYVFLLAVLAIPVALACFPEGASDLSPTRIGEFYGNAGVWIWLGVFGVCQALFLIVPVRAAEARPVGRRHIAGAALACAFLFALLILGFTLSLALAWRGDRIQEEVFWGHFYAAGVFWAVWAVVFYRFHGARNPLNWAPRLARWLYRGSIAELLIAVPSHIIARQRDDCCAPVLTFFGIATGLSVLLLSFGPGVLFLFADRFRRLQPRTSREGVAPAPGQSALFQ